ncbi:MAG: NAD(P)-dependent oxidoreductase [Deltaproteobacteria bacterium]|nr:NAD(P)-dependent oxidoreductase [Deltaproteobacteria bacterium]MBW2422273.1 NAD(P)-dependent oxidoreductase [Deltaproteobacteria bacterium]
MRVTVTGAFGNVGQSALVELLERGHEVRALDLRSAESERAAQRYRDRVEVAWGDVRVADDVAGAMTGADAVAHTAFVIPPLSEREPELAQAVNVDGTRNLIAAMQAQPSPPRLVYTSSVSVTGPRGPEDEPPVTAEHPLVASDHYTRHKIETERMVRESGLDWCILRLGAVLPLVLPRRFDPMAFDVPSEQRMEIVHTRDVGLAIARAVDCDEALGRILLIAGGERCRMTSGQMRARFADVTGMSPMPDSAFSTRPFYMDYMDTREAQRILEFQRFDFDDYIRDLQKSVPAFRRLVVRSLGGLISRYLLRQSPYYRSAL